MNKLENAIATVKDCDLCYGQGFIGWSSPDGDYDYDFCECNPLELILDGDEIVWDSGLLFETQEAK